MALTILSWLWVPASLYAYYLGIVTPFAYWAVKTLNDEDQHVVASSSSSSASKKGERVHRAKFPLNYATQLSKSIITSILLLVVSIPFYLPVIYFFRRDYYRNEHVVARYLIGAVAVFMNFRVLQLVIFAPYKTRNSWSIVRFFVECTNLVYQANPQQKKDKSEDEGEEEKPSHLTKRKVHTLKNWGSVIGFAGQVAGRAILKVAALLSILYLFKDYDTESLEINLPSISEIFAALPALFLGIQNPFGLQTIGWYEFLYFFFFNGFHSFALFLLLSAFSDVGVASGAVLLGPSQKEAVVDIWNAPFLATSPRDFWGRRWNLLFRAIFHQLVFVPVAVIIDPLLGYLDMQSGKRKIRAPSHLAKKSSGNALRSSPEARLIAATAVFLISGLIHEFINYVAFAEYTMENVAFFLVHAAACAVQTQAIQTYPNWKMGKFSSTAQRLLFWFLNVVFLLLTAPLFFGPYQRINFFPRFLKMFGLRK